MWTNALSTNVGSHVSKDLGEELKDIDARLRVKMSVDSIVLATEKCFSETSNFPKDDGDDFKVHMEECYLGHLLCHIPSTKGNRQDIAFQSVGPAFMGIPFCTEFLDRKLRSHQNTRH